MHEPPDIRGSRILVVDDEHAVLVVLQQALEELGCAVECTTDPEQALAHLRDQPCHLLICDKNLPGTSGLDLIARARAHDPDLACILITAYASLESAIESLRLGVFDYLLKPFERIELVTAKARLALEHQRLAAYNRQLLERLRAADQDLDAVRRRLGLDPTAGPDLQQALQRAIADATATLSAELEPLKRLAELLRNLLPQLRRASDQLAQPGPEAQAALAKLRTWFERIAAMLPPPRPPGGPERSAP